MDEMKIKEFLDGIESLKALLNDFKQGENMLVEQYGTPKYYLNEVVNDNSTLKKEITLKKYVLGSLEKTRFINANELKKGKFLFDELLSLINGFLGTDYVLIFFLESRRNFNDEYLEVFNLSFKRNFSTSKSGHVKIYKTEDCSKEVQLGEIIKTESNLSKISVDLVRKNNLVYEGASFENENILFYGHNIEENPFLVKLFEKNSPKNLLNIIPLNGFHSFSDNVD